MPYRTLKKFLQSVFRKPLFRNRIWPDDKNYDTQSSIKEHKTCHFSIN